MRLLNTTTIELAEFVGEAPPYAILSHTWGDEEVTFRDMTVDKQEATRKKAYSKILGACSQALAHGSIEWMWIDTCCIDKSSSAELSEAINSMFRWYRNAEICFAYLSDVLDPHDGAQFSASRWFTRGWTLQELLAPAIVEFYTSTWELIGNKFVLVGSIAHITGIDSLLLGGDVLYLASVAQRMSWASKRKTTREEDIAYCLLGIFGANMPLLYGEGKAKAFRRLQEEIMKDSNDESIFAWGWGHDYTADNWRIGTTTPGYLAESPEDFAHSGDIVPSDVHSPNLIATHIGITLEAPVCRQVQENSTPVRGCCYIPIRCRPEVNVLSLLAIPVICTKEASQEYYRVTGSVILVPREAWNRSSVACRHLNRTLPNMLKGKWGKPRDRRFALRSVPAGFGVVDVWPPETWSYPTPPPLCPMDQWTKAVWIATVPRGYVHLKWIGQHVVEAGHITDRSWPDLLLCLDSDMEADNNAGLVVFPEAGSLPEIARQRERPEILSQPLIERDTGRRACFRHGYGSDYCLTGIFFHSSTCCRRLNLFFPPLVPGCLFARNVRARVGSRPEDPQEGHRMIKH